MASSRVLFCSFMLLMAAAHAVAQPPPYPPRSDANWQSVPGTLLADGPIASGPTASAIAPNGDVYIAGNVETSPLHFVSRVCRWDGTRWTFLGDRLEYPPSVYGVRVNAITVHPSGDVYVTGVFTRAYNTSGPVLIVGNVARWNAALARWESLGFGMNASGYTIGCQPGSGNIIVGGNFNAVYDSNSTIHSFPSIARWNVSLRQWEPLGGGMTGTVQTLACSDSVTVYAGGYFPTVTQTGGAQDSANGIARWDGSGWHALGKGVGSTYATVMNLTVDGSGRVIIGGGFDFARNAGGGTVNGPVVRWDGTQWSTLTNGLPYLSIDKLATPAPGSPCLLTHYAQTARVMQLVGSTWITVGIVDGETVRTMAASLRFGSPRVHIGGLFTTVRDTIGGSLTLKNNALWDGNSWSGMVDPFRVDGGVLALDYDYRRDHIVVGGSFSTISGKAYTNIAFVSATGVSAPGTGVDGAVRAVTTSSLERRAWHSKYTYVGGDFTIGRPVSGPNVALRHVGAWNHDAGVWEPLGRGVNGPVYALAVFSYGASTTYLFVGGAFDSVYNADGSALKVGNIAIWDIDSTKWHSVGGLTGAGGVVRTLYAPLRPDSMGVYVGGSFTTATDPDGTVRTANNIAFWWGGLGSFNSSAHWQPVGSGTNGEVRTIKGEPAWALWVGGAFSTVGQPDGSTVPAANIAMWFPYGHQWSPLGSGVNGPVNTIERLFDADPSNEAIVVGGEFTRANSIFFPSTNNIAIFEFAPYQQLAHQGWSQMGSGTDSTVYALLSPRVCNYIEGELAYVGGRFAHAGTLTSPALARWRRLHYIVMPVVIASGSVGHQTGSILSLGIQPCATPLLRKQTAADRAHLGVPDSLLPGRVIMVDSIPTSTPFSITLNDQYGNEFARFDSLLYPRGASAVAMLRGVDAPQSYAVNPDGRSTALGLSIVPLAVSDPTDSQHVHLFLGNMVTDAPALTIVQQGAPAVRADSVRYGDVAGPIDCSPGIHTFDVLITKTGQKIGSFPVDLTGKGGSAETIVATGFLIPSANLNGPPLTLEHFGPSTVVTGVKARNAELPQALSLSQNYPNPFNPATTIAFGLPANGEVRLEVYDVLGRRVAVLVSEEMAAGPHTVRWTPEGNASGVYLCRLTMGSASLTRKMLFVR